MERLEDAKRILEEALGIFDSHAELHFTFAVYYEHKGNFDAMVKHLKQTIDIDPAHADAMNFLGYSYAEKSVNLEEALMLIQNSLALKPGNGYITDSLGWVYFKMGKYDKALKTLLKASDIISDDPVILEHLGDAYLANDNKPKAIDAWERTLKADNMEKEMIERVEQKLKNLKQDKGL
jgi:tetratricopeptide (TPR) repeat protein